MGKFFNIILGEDSSKTFYNLINHDAMEENVKSYITSLIETSEKPSHGKFIKHIQSFESELKTLKEKDAKAPVDFEQDEWGNRRMRSVVTQREGERKEKNNIDQEDQYLI